MRPIFNPPYAQRGEGNRAKHGGGTIPAVADFRSTALRAVPLPTDDGEDEA